MPQVSPATRNREANRASGPAQLTNQARRRRQSQCPSDDSAYGSGVGDDDANVHIAQYRRADGTFRSVRQPESGVSDLNEYSNIAGYFPRPCAYWSDGVDGDTRAKITPLISRWRLLARPHSHRIASHTENDIPNDFFPHGLSSIRKVVLEPSPRSRSLHFMSTMMSIAVPKHTQASLKSILYPPDTTMARNPHLTP